MTKYIKMNRRGHEVTVPEGLISYVHENDLNLAVIKAPGKKPSTLQISKGNTYLGTVKTLLGVIGFKNGNPLDFRKTNVILSEEVEADLKDTDKE